MKIILKKYWQVFVITGIFLFFPNIYILATGYMNMYEMNDEEIQNHHFYYTDVAIVFGAGALPSGPSAVFQDRLNIAYDLYTNKNISKILISGDNSEQNYNEPLTGKKYLVSKGIPAEKITLDYAGFRTYDTCVRAHKLWDIENAYLITQEFHLSRAMFTCRHFNIINIGVSASTQNYKYHWKNLIRETLAQQKAFYEVLFFPHNPKFLGEKEEL